MIFFGKVITLYISFDFDLKMGKGVIMKGLIGVCVCVLLPLIMNNFQQLSKKEG